MSKTLRIATRKSPLALWQANEVGRLLTEFHPDLNIELVTMKTKGDKILDTPLAKVGGKGLFVKELETGMLEGNADIPIFEDQVMVLMRRSRYFTHDYPQSVHTKIFLKVYCSPKDSTSPFNSFSLTKRLSLAFLILASNISDDWKTSFRCLSSISENSKLPSALLMGLNISIFLKR